MMADRRPAGGRSGSARHSGRPASGGWQVDGHTHFVEPLYTLSDEYNHRFFGLEMYQNAVAPMLLNFLVEVAHPARVIEIGTSKGGLSYLFTLGSELCGYDFITVDIEDTAAYTLPGATVIVGDVFDIGLEDYIAAAGRTILLCDGGDKRREFDTFARYLKPGDIIGAHDYYTEERYWAWSEITEEDVARTCARYGLVPYLQEEFARAAWLMRIRKTGARARAPR